MQLQHRPHLWNSSVPTRKRVCVIDANPKFSSEVPEVGLEPTRPCGHWILNPARLPIPPLWQLVFNGF